MSRVREGGAAGAECAPIGAPLEITRGDRGAALMLRARPKGREGESSLSLSLSLSFLRLLVLILFSLTFDGPVPQGRVHHRWGGVQASLRSHMYSVCMMLPACVGTSGVSFYRAARRQRSICGSLSFSPQE